MTMIRKQIYIGEEEEQYLKRRAHELRTTEAAVIRELIKQDSRKTGTGRNEAADRLRVLMLKRRAALPNGGGTERFDREALYERQDLAAKHFVDSNVFIYALDAKNLAKMDRAQAVVNHVSDAKSGLVSVQVLNETYSNLVKVSKLAMPPAEARESIETIIGAFPVEQLTLEHMRDAMRISVQFQTSYYDGLLFAVARAAGAETLLTEDLQAEQVIDGVRILHVLDNEFDLSRLD